MSGIVGFMNTNREPASSEILFKMVRPLQSKSPDGTHTWLKGSVCLGHALLNTSVEESIVEQPCTLDSAVWVSSDAHIYGREELVEKLKSASVQVKADESDPNLVLMAYRVFGDEFARHLIGDFAIAIWDEVAKKLICVRDHLGVRPLFYANLNGVLVFGSDIDALLAHPKIDAELDESFIADFLLFGAPIDPTITVYSQIKRLPAAHYLMASDAGITVNRYWSPPTHQTIRYTHGSEYTEHFSSIFEKAVIQRIPKAQVTLELTGGMDSSSIAAVVSAHACENGQKVTAYTNTCNKYFPEDREGELAELIAEYLGISLHLIATENYPLFDRFDNRVLRSSEPRASPAYAHHYDTVRRVAESGCRVLLTGQLGDSVFAGRENQFLQLLKTGRFIQFATDLSVHRRYIGSFSGTGLLSVTKRKLRGMLGRGPWQPDKPQWLTSDFARRIQLEDRWLGFWQKWAELNDICGQLQRPWFSTMFDDHETPNVPLLVRHPFSDIRLWEFMMGVPNYIHFNKRVLREAMQGRLPREILSRPKEGLVGDVQRAKMLAGFCYKAPAMQAICSYVEPEIFENASREFVRQEENESTWSTCLINAPVALAYWMNNNVRKAESL